MPNDPATTMLAAIESRARRIETPCGGGNMVWREWGDGEPLVLLHGGSGSWRHWLRNIEHFAQTRRVIAANMPGFGDSAEPPSPVSFASLGAIMGAGLETILGKGSRYDIMGFSLGSFMAPWVMKACGAKANRFVLIHGHFVGRMAYSPQGTLRRWRGVTDKAVRDDILRGNLGTLMLANPQAADDLTLHVYSNDLDQARLRVPTFIDTLDTDILRDLDARLFAISGSKDPTGRPSPAEQQALLRGMRPDAQCQIVEGAGHWLMWEAPETFHTLADAILQAE